MSTDAQTLTPAQASPSVPAPYAHLLPAMVHSSDAVMITNRNGVIEYVNPAFEAMTGYSAGELIGATPALLKSGRQDVDFYRMLWRMLRAGGAFRGVIINRRKNGEFFHEDETIRPLFDASGEITHFVATGRDVTARVRNLERWSAVAKQDTVTKLPLRDVFFERLELALHWAPWRREGFAVGVVAIDHFGLVGGAIGHQGADKALRACAARLQTCVGEADLVTRFGGGEFAVLLHDAADEAECAHVFARIINAFAAPLDVDGHPISMTVSVGAGLYPAHGGDGPALMQSASTALAMVVRNGGNGYRLHAASSASQ